MQKGGKEMIHPDDFPPRERRQGHKFLWGLLLVGAVLAVTAIRCTGA